MVIQILYRLLHSLLFNNEEVQHLLESTHPHALFVYKHAPVRNMIRKIKYYGNRRFADIAGKFLYTKLIHIVNGQNLDKDLPILLIPVPISSKRLRQRGYNQVVLITKSVLAQDEKHLFGDGACIVTKIKDTQSQTMCTRKQRLTNLSGVFHVSNPEKVIHRVVVLIDDVTTTGTTFSEISRVLMSAGAKRVITLALAH